MATAEELDRWYGVLNPPTLIKEIEQVSGFNKVIELDRSFATTMGSILEMCNDSQQVREYFDEIIWLWVVDRDGAVRISIEECCLVSRPDSPFTRVRKMPRVNEVAPLGHPALVGNQSARIGGELYLDETDEGELIWVIDNQSGRYGKRVTTRIENLKNVQALFVQSGLAVDIDFVRPT